MRQRDTRNRLRIIEENTTGRNIEQSGILKTGNTALSNGIQIQDIQNIYRIKWPSPF